MDNSLIKRSLLGIQEIRDVFYPWLTLQSVKSRVPEWLREGVCSHCLAGRPPRKRIVLYVDQFHSWRMEKEKNGERV